MPMCKEFIMYSHTLSHIHVINSETIWCTKNDHWCSLYFWKLWRFALYNANATSPSYILRYRSPSTIPTHSTTMLLVKDVYTNLTITFVNVFTIGSHLHCTPYNTAVVLQCTVVCGVWYIYGTPRMLALLCLSVTALSCSNAYVWMHDLYIICCSTFTVYVHTVGWELPEAADGPHWGSS